MQSFDKIQKIVAEYAEINFEEILLDSTMESLGLDSLDFVEIITDIEKELEIKIPDEIASDFETIKDICNYIDNL